MRWESVIGLEVHVQLDTRSKIFSGAASVFGAAPNTQACPVDLGLPGVLPVLNEAAVRMAVKFGLAIGAEIHMVSIFDRKNYFYPDLPKGYQISQFKNPIVGRGSLTIQVDTEPPRTIGITRAHLEEDAGKSIHDAYAGQTGIDLNRTGTPLLEVVSEPDLRTAAQAAAFFRQLASLVRHLKICDGQLAQGSMRCDANVSVRPAGESQLGVRSEIKNINSFRFVEMAINYEIERQIDLLERGEEVERDTRLYDPERNETRSMRSKELSNDYRYFPDPDLLPLRLTSKLIESVRADLPELPDVKRQRYLDEFSLSEYDAAWLTQDPDVADYFDAVSALIGEPKLAANWIMGELSAALNDADLAIMDSPVSAASLGNLLERIRDGTISGKIAKTIFESLWSQGGEVDEIIRSRGLEQVSDTAALMAVINEVIRGNPGQVAQYRDGKTKVFGFFVGQVMKATRGRANPREVTTLLEQALSERP
jgi:aspartyl-tRNA(Asn)/glutamyl-tRNA(Gln) amidotransferase subunit B